jgi:hypothetical protein
MSESGHSRQRRTEPIVDPCPATPKSGRKFTGVGAAPGLRPRRDERLPSKGDVRSRADDGAPVAGNSRWRRPSSNAPPLPLVRGSRRSASAGDSPRSCTNGLLEYVPHCSVSAHGHLPTGGQKCGRHR